jgi:hypothetical protein
VAIKRIDVQSFDYPRKSERSASYFECSIVVLQDYDLAFIVGFA